MRARMIVAAVGMATVAWGAHAQDINIDFGNTAGVPSNAYVAAAGTPGLWNALDATVGVPLPVVDVNGAAGPVTLTNTGSFGVLTNLNPLVTDPDDIALMCDILNTGSLPVDFVVAGLEPGKYDIYTYAWAPDSDAFISGVTVNGVGPDSVGGTWPGSQTLGTTYAKHTLDVTGDVTITISAVASFGSLNGIQIRKSGPPLLSLQLAAPIPETILPGVPATFDATINPNTEALVGTPQFCYRFAPGAFTCVNMVNTGGLNWRGTLPAPACTDAPEFYFTATGTVSGPKTLPFGAPASVYSTIVATGTAPTVLTEGFNGPGIPSGWTATGLWNVTDLCPGSSASCDGGSYAYFGDTGACNFDLGTVEGTLGRTVTIGDANATLEFCFRYDGEGGNPWDAAGVMFNGTEVWTVPGTTLDWTPVSVDMSSFAGQEGTLEFFFDSVDGIANASLGFQVDGFKLNTEGFVCGDDCYPDCDGSGVLDIDDFICFQTFFAIGDPYADCDASGSLDIDDFICFQTFFAIGC